MKDSGIPWIGKIPINWEISKIKRIMRNKSVRNYPDEMVLSLYREFGVIPKDSRNDNHNVTSEDTSNYKFVEVGNFVINKMKAWQGSMGLSNYQGIISPAYYVCKFIDNNVYSKYIHHLLRNETYKPEYLRLSTGMRVGQWDLGIDDFLNIPIILPPNDIQIKIVSFLDLKCANIDQLIALQQQMIDELKAYKQSVITEAVTKGLDKSVPMKDSGIEWIGDIPSSWNVVQLSSIFKEHKNKNKLLEVVNLLSLSYGRIIKKNINTKEGLLPQSFDGYNIIQEGDIVFRLTDLQNDKKSLRTGICKEKGIITSAYITLRKTQELHSDYFHYLFHSYDVSKVFYGLGDGVRQGMTFDDLRKLLLIYPPLHIQQQITFYLDQKSKQIEYLISIKQQKIDELKEYKKSMIYEYITGKKQVPN